MAHKSDEYVRLGVELNVKETELEIIKADHVAPVQREINAIKLSMKQWIIERDQVVMDFEDNTGGDAA
jgi:hypothetical protein